MSAKKNLNFDCPELDICRVARRATTPQFAQNNRLKIPQNRPVEVRQSVSSRNDPHALFSMTYTRFYSHSGFD